MKLIAAFFLVSFALAQNPVAAFRVAGYLVDSATGEPVRRGSVSLQVVRGTPAPKAITVADAGGHFEFSGLPIGTYQLTGERRGYPAQTFSPREGFSVTADILDISFRMQPYAALTGTVVDENNDPIAGAVIQLIRSQIQQGRRELQPSVSAVTDDRGEYRVGSLVSGRYYVSAYARAQDAGVSNLYARRFFPAASDLLSAIPLDLEAGANQRADFRLQPEPVFHVRGQVSGADLLSGVSVMLTPRTSAEAFGGTGFPVRFIGDGKFEFSGVTPGQYAITATGARDGAIHTASQIIAVGAADLEGVTLTPGPLAALNGQVSIESKEGTEVLRLDRIHVTLQPEDSILKPVLVLQIKEDRSFAIAQAAAGEYSLRVNVPEHFYLKSAKAGALDVVSGGLAVPAGGAVPTLELVIGSNGGEVSGTVKVQDKPAANCTVLLLRKNSSSASQDKMTVTDAEGKFLVRAVAPGEYTAYAWRNMDEVEYRNPQAMTQYSGVAVTVAEGAKQVVELKLNGN